MVGKIEFPEGVTWDLRRSCGADFFGEGFTPSFCGDFYYYANNYVVDIKYDTSKATSMSYMFYGCSNLLSAPRMDTSNVTNMSYMFYDCEKLLSVPQMDTSNVTNMQNMFYYCKKLTTIPQLDTQNVTNMERIFHGCENLTTIPQLDTSKVTNMQYMFYNCSKLKELPDFNCVKVQNFGTSSSSSWLYNCYPSRIGVVDCDSVTNVNYFFGNASRTYLTEFGGCRNLGKASSVSNTNSAYFMAYAPNLTYESVMNVINLLYDRAANGLSTLTLKLHANHMAMLSADDIAIATNKGWSLTS